jgi:hypothetical protein
MKHFNYDLFNVAYFTHLNITCGILQVVSKINFKPFLVDRLKSSGKYMSRLL